MILTTMLGFAPEQAIGTPPGFYLMGPGSGGETGVPSIELEGVLSPGNRVSVHVRGARPLAFAHLVIGFQRIDAMFKNGGTFFPAPEHVVVRLRTGNDGHARQTFTYPHGMPQNTLVYLQFWVEDPSRPDGWSSTPGMQVVTP